jgi:hypothetical protein
MAQDEHRADRDGGRAGEAGKSFFRADEIQQEKRGEDGDGHDIDREFLRYEQDDRDQQQREDPHDIPGDAGCLKGS